MPNQFALKPWLIRFVFEQSDIENVFWIDSGIVTFGTLGIIFEYIENTVYGLLKLKNGFIIILHMKNVKK